MRWPDHRAVDGWLVPLHEIDRVVRRRFGSDGSIARLVGHCGSRKVAIQAGGNWGYWPRRLAGLFQAVYTFEPDPVCFVALAANTRECRNVIRLQAALGKGPALVDLWRRKETSGSQYVSGPGQLPTLRIDDLGLEMCDLIALDIEGSEFDAVRGAAETIARCHPVVSFEDKGHGARFGAEKGALEQWMGRQFGYRAVDRIGHDVVMVAE